MNRKHYILSTALLLMATGSCLQSCKDDFMGILPDTGNYEQEQYLTARSINTFSALEEMNFEIGTPYRLLAFSKPYNPEAPESEENTVNFPRFNKIAWEGATSTGLRFINIEKDPDKWFGFSAITELGEIGDDKDGLVSLDFYGFTLGRTEEDRQTSYLELGLESGETLSGENRPAEGSLSTLLRRETVSNDNILHDLLWGKLLNQNIKTAGIGAEVATQSIMPFKHCFSQLHFMVVQQESDTKGEPCYPGIQIDKIEVTGTYGAGDVYLQDGKVKLQGEKIDRPLKFKSEYKGDVTMQQIEIGDMIVFPSDGEALKNENMADGYEVGLRIKVKSKNKHPLEQFLANITDNPKPQIKKEHYSDGEYHTLTIEKQCIIDNYSDTEQALKFRQNTGYTLVISFQKDNVRIITLIPQVFEWLPGEGTADDPWDMQPMGQPQMFNNIVWSDRNLGAGDYDPINGENYEKTMGYFYQSGRNIPYYPFKPNASGGAPDFSALNGQNLSGENTAWGESPFRFYPIVDPKILNMYNTSSWTMKYKYEYEEGEGDNKKKVTKFLDPCMAIPESKPKSYYDFMTGLDNGTSSGLQPDQDTHWENGQQNQPVAGSWIIPTSQQFLTIFPSTPHAGNITMKTGGNNYTPMQWGDGDEDEKDNNNTRKTQSETLRVTVPFYKSGMAEPTGRSEEYINAWKTLADRPEENEEGGGTTHLNDYTKGSPEASGNTWLEPDGDPENGFASVYVISREEGSSISLSGLVEDESKFSIKEWGTIYAIKNVYTPQAYRMRWRALIRQEEIDGTTKKTRNPRIYIEICRYRCTPDNVLTEKNYLTDYDWDHPAATLYFPISGLGDWSGQYINFGTECQYATSDPISNDGKTSAVQIKITGNNGANAYIAVIRNVINRNFGKQIRPIVGGALNSSK